MTTNELGDEMLMAYADGELSEADAAVIEQAIARNPGLSRRLDQFRASRRLASASLAGLRASPVLPRLAQAVLDYPNPTDAGPRPPVSSRLMSSRLLPLAASVAIVAGIAGYLAGVNREGSSANLEVSSAMAAALESAPSGGTRQVHSGERMTIQATYRLPDRACRKFLLQKSARAIVGLACRENVGWSIDLAVAQPGGDPRGYSPASARLTQTIDAFLDAAEASVPLDAKAEAELIAGGWKHH
jgi:hypothetical protein